MITKPNSNTGRKKRHAHVRRNLSGTPQRPRLNVFRSSKHIYAQLIDDVNGVTLAQASSLDKELKIEKGSNKEAARQVGEAVAKRAIEAGHEVIVFDRGGYLYHGRVAELADAAREAGLKF
ncbi:MULTISPECIES: 50S ribosomal protein L18 [Shouchella]|uniref:Large ribosomal subunit protein uL18 n=5 Tax=Bacillaceae TaxID=186817 RepID=A0A060LRN9_9BACI|nr:MULTISPECIES: 50S ribosomal protein L18 [Bacillaceae]RQW23604.1 50S ribosomal protein L18 [Bacillus sp. C1-1]GAF22602.1 LSU ribosomal protein L18p [Bacillus sp. JCM 19047]AIC92670.1 50S ribosomal protein L18 [Shouchella lehensis G1]KQL56875.1 50S ribosomal protein L18 [Alkalicoccobacillus plakortidis]MBG9782458.1 50S ribosomal protein L18 [Shouchella lehensis]